MRRKQLPKDHVFETPDGWECMVDGRTFGTWASPAIAKAGVEVEQLRALRGKVRSVPWTPGNNRGQYEPQT